FSNSIVKQEDFFKLLIAQLKNQDPMNPVENQEFVSELAQFSALEQQTNQTKILEQMLAQQQGDATTQALSLIGKEVSTENTAINYEPGDSMRYLFHTDGAANVMVQVTSASGKVVATEMVSVSSAGQHEYLFEGKNESGQSLVPGQYTISFGSTVSSDGSQTEYPSYMMGMVDGVNFVNGEPVLMVNGQNISLASVVAVYQATGTTGAA
ncbi:MAG: flagellar hook assembly protein FlgD, partial [bacterium]|nr:flagellar hook assembly protein FlgD [bacterium]